MDSPVLAALYELGVFSVVPSPASASLKSSAYGGPDKKKRSDGRSKSSLDVHDIAPDTSEAIHAWSGLPPKRVSLCKVSKSAASSNVAPASSFAACWKALADEERAEWNAKAKSQQSSENEAELFTTPHPYPKEAKQPAAPKKETKKETIEAAKKDEAGPPSDGAKKKTQSGYLIDYGSAMRAYLDAAGR